MRRLSPFLVLAIASCFPELPDEDLITNLRILAVRVDPPTARLDQWPPPLITLSVLVVDPEDPELDGVTHHWRLELGEGDQAEALAGLIPEGPWGPSIMLNLGALFARDGGLVPGALPVAYTATSEDDEREAIKLVHFLLPDLGGDDDSADDDSAAPAQGDDDSADDDSAAPAQGDDDSAAIAEGVNEEPHIVSIALEDGSTWEGDALPGPDAPLWLGLADASEGLTFTVTLADDEGTHDLHLHLVRTEGCSGLPLEAGAAPGDGGGGFFGGATATDDDDPCSHVSGGGGGGFGGGFGNDDEDPSVQTFDWTPWVEETGLDARLFLVLRDGDGAQTWQEIRIGEPPGE